MKCEPDGPSSIHRRRGRPKTASDEARCAEIVRAALELFSERGYAGTTMDALAAHCQISKRTLYLSFPSKKVLFAAIIRAHRHCMLDLPRQAKNDDLAAEIAAIFRLDGNPEEDHERSAFVQMILLEANRSPEIAELLKRYGVDEARQLLADWLAEQQSRGLIALDDVDSGARLLMDIVFGATCPRLGAALEWPDPEQKNAHIRRSIDIFLGGARPRPDGQQTKTKARPLGPDL